MAERLSSDDLRALQEEIRAHPARIQAFQHELSRRPEALAVFEEALRKKATEAGCATPRTGDPLPDDDARPCATPSPRESRSSLGTDVGRFKATVRRNQYEDEQMRLVLASALAADGNAVDIGAHGGSVLREILRIAPRGKHIAYEPLPVQARRLAHLFPEVDVRQVALADHDGEATFVHVTTLSPWSGLHERPYPDSVKPEDLEEIPVRLERLDHSLPEGYVPSLIKVDVEGAEEWVLQGALRILTTSRPLVIFEHDAVASDGYGTTSASLYHLLCDEAGFRVFDLAGDGPYTIREFEESQRQLRWVNYIARP